MKNTIKLLLLFPLIMEMTAAPARTVKSNTKKVIAPSNEKTIKTTVSNIGAVDPGINTSDDTTAEIPNAPWYTSKEKRPINIQDIYVGAGGAFLTGTGGNKKPFNSGFSVNATYGTALYDKYLLLEVNNHADLMSSPNKEWFSRAFAVKQSELKNITTGFYDEFDISLHVVILGSSKLSFTAGPLLGGKLMMLPSMNIGRNLYYVSAPITFSYGIKTNLYIGKRIYCYGQYSNTAVNSVTGHTSPPESDIAGSRKLPVSFGSCRIGIGYIFQPTW